MSNVIDFTNWKTGGKSNPDMSWALTMTFDVSNQKNKFNSVDIDIVEKKLQNMAEYSDAKNVLRKFSTSK